MMNSLFSAVLLAQDNSAPLWMTIAPYIVIAFIAYLLLIKPKMDEQKTHRNLLQALKKNDRVVTIGGIYGVVASVNRDRDEVVLKVDEANNTKLMLTLGSIARVLTEGEKNEKT